MWDCRGCHLRVGSVAVEVFTQAKIAVFGCGLLNGEEKYFFLAHLPGPHYELEVDHVLVGVAVGDGFGEDMPDDNEEEFAGDSKACPERNEGMALLPGLRRAGRWNCAFQ